MNWRSQPYTLSIRLGGAVTAETLCRQGDAALATQGNLNNDIGVPLMALRLQGERVSRLAVEIDGDDVLDGERAAHRGAGVNVKRRGVAPRAAMAVVVDVFRALQHADGIDQILLDLLLRRLRHDALLTDPLLPQIPRPADCLHVDHVSQGALLRIERGDPAAERDGLVLDIGADDREDRTKYGDRQRRPDRHHAVRTQKRHRLVGERLGQRRALVGRRDHDVDAAARAARGTRPPCRAGRGALREALFGARHLNRRKHLKWTPKDTPPSSPERPPALALKPPLIWRRPASST